MREEITLFCIKEDKRVAASSQFTHLQHYRNICNITKGHAFQIYAVVKNVEKHVGVVCVCVRRPSPPYPVCSEGLVVSLYVTHETVTLGRYWYPFLTAGRNSHVLPL